MVRPISFPLIHAFVESAHEMSHPDDVIDYATYKGVVSVTRVGKRFKFTAPYLSTPVMSSAKELEITLLSVAY